MSQSNGIFPHTCRAPSPVAARRCVGFDGAQIAAQGAKVLGVAAYGAAEGEYYVAECVGTAVVEAGGAFAVGDSLIADAQGRAIAASGPLGIAAGGLAVTSSAANGAILDGADLPEFVFADALEASSGGGKFVEVLLRR